jgi:hypothetical protein
VPDHAAAHARASPGARGARARDREPIPQVPVIAADGHTYDRSAIERWLLHHDNSPKTGERLEHRMLVPNHNLKRLVDDLVLEGGAGLYSSAEGGATPLCDAREERKTFETADDGMPRPPSSSGRPGGRRAELASEPVLLLQCLGPPESEWNGRSFEVSKNGVVGGRRRPSASGGAPDDGGGIGDRDFMPFADSTVSRRAGQESEIPNFKASYLGRFPLVLADFWTSDHLSERSRRVDAFSGTRARGTLTLKRR